MVVSHHKRWPMRVSAWATYALSGVRAAHREGVSSERAGYRRELHAEARRSKPATRQLEGLLKFGMHEVHPELANHLLIDKQFYFWAARWVVKVDDPPGDAKRSDLLDLAHETRPGNS